MKTKHLEPIIIYDDDYSGDYVVTARKRQVNSETAMQTAVAVLVILAVAVIGFAVVSRLLRKMT